jgi:endogenous inhibitor of DNA gyrase (YacG/DUF329 family)
MNARVVSCPRCGKAVTWDPANAYRPFCSERCRLIDLGAWATERYRIPVQDSKEGVDAAQDSKPPESQR